MLVASAANAFAGFGAHLVSNCVLVSSEGCKMWSSGIVQAPGLCLGFSGNKYRNCLGLNEMRLSLSASINTYTMKGPLARHLLWCS